MELNSGHPSSTVVGRNLFECFPDLPRKLVENKIKSVFILKNFAFSGWEQRSYLFKFRHNRPVSGGVEYMYHDCTFVPIKNEKDEVEHICVTVVDTTDVAIYKSMHKEARDSLAEASQRDGLSAAFNRRFLEESIAKEFDRAHRYGGEEFCVPLPETTLEGVQAYAEHIRCTIEKADIAFGTSTIPVTISIGVAQYHDKMTRHEELIKSADDALYRTRNSGHNCVRCADPPSFAAITTHCNGL